MLNIIFHTISILLLLAIFIMTILIYSRQSQEKFENCFGAQYDGSVFLNDEKAPVCPKGYTPPYRTGGCADYDPQEISVRYAKGDKNFIQAV